MAVYYMKQEAEFSPPGSRLLAAVISGVKQGTVLLTLLSQALDKKTPGRQCGIPMSQANITT
jgi:hypothetical protein